VCSKFKFQVEKKKNKSFIPETTVAVEGPPSNYYSVAAVQLKNEPCKMMTTETTESFDPEPSARSEVSEVEAEDEDGDVVMPLREKIVRQESTMRMGTVGLASQATKMDRKRFIEEAETSYLFYPWTRSYRIWWGITAVGAIATIFTETYGKW
jgi:hypothetical protein